MAKVKIQGHASGTGVFTLTSPNSNTDRTITLPDADVTLGTDATKLPLAGGTLTGNLLTNSSSKIGIGTTAPNRMFTVEGHGNEPDISLVQLDNTNNNFNEVRFLSVGSDDSTRRVGASVKGIYTTHNATNPTTDLSFETRNASGALAERLRIMSDGKLKVGTTDNGTITSTFALVLDPPTGEPIVFRTAGTDIARFRPGGGLCFGTDTAAANALHDYEEGTWSPTITCETSGSYTLQGGADLAAYTKIGRVVTVQGGLSVNGESSPSGNLRITLPFTAFTGADDTDYCMGNLALGNHGSTLDVAGLNAFTYGGAYFHIWGVNPDGTTRYIKHTDVDTNFQVYFNFSYIAA